MKNSDLRRETVIPVEGLDRISRRLLSALINGPVRICELTDFGLHCINGVRSLRNHGWEIIETRVDIDAIEYTLIFQKIPANVLRAAKRLLAGEVL
jgi:hypothetical protein